MMKAKHIYGAIGALMLAIPVVASAQDAPRPNAPVPPPVVRERVQMIKENEDYRNEVRARIATTSAGAQIAPVRAEAKERLEERKEQMQERREEVLDNRADRRENIADRREDIAERREDLQAKRMERVEERNERRIEIFNEQKSRLVSQLNRSISNLEQIRTRIAERIEKAASSTRDMSEARTALAIADQKIASAKSAVQALEAYVPPVIDNSVSSTTPPRDMGEQRVRVEAARQVGQQAINAVREAREALVATVRAIAHNMGLGDKNATSTPNSTQ